MSFAGFLISLAAVLAGVGVVAFKNPLYSAFSLIMNLLAVAGLYAVMNAHFLAVSQVVVYAGAIMVLVLFVLMLLNLKTESTSSIGFGRLTLAVLGSAIVLTTVIPPIFAAFSSLTPTQLEDAANRSEGTVYNVGRVLYTKYLVQFELASLVLLIGIVGAVMLARRKSSELGPRSEGMEPEGMSTQQGMGGQR